MNQENIGKFISKERKNKELTQKELADKLNISEKTISKWECGKGLPEVSLMQPLCKELDISVNELLNGAKDPQEDKAIIEYVKYEKKKSKKKIITLTIVSILLITFILSTIIYFFGNYGKTAVYQLYGESKNFHYTDGLFIKSNTKNVLVSGELIIKNSEKLKEEDIISVILKNEDQVIVGGTTNISIEDNGYNEIFSKEKIDNIDNWYLEVTFEDESGTTIEKIKINNKIIIKNTNYLPKSMEAISEEKIDNKDTIEKEVIKENEQLKKKLLSEGYIQVSSNILKKEMKNMTIKVDTNSGFVRVNSNNSYESDGFDIKYNSEKYPENHIYYAKKQNENTEEVLYDVENNKVTCLTKKCSNELKKECEEFYKFIAENIKNKEVKK